VEHIGTYRNPKKAFTSAKEYCDPNEIINENVPQGYLGVDELAPPKAQNTKHT